MVSIWRGHSGSPERRPRYTLAMPSSLPISAIPWLGRFTAWSSQIANKHGIYLGRRSTKIHVALYRWSEGKFGGHMPGWPQARIALLNHAGAKSGVKRTSPLIYHEDAYALA